MRLFDLHCDTLTVAMQKEIALRENDLQLSFAKGAAYLPWIQSMAVFVPDSLRGDAAREYFDRAYAYWNAQLAENPQIVFCKDRATLQETVESVGQGGMLTVEGGAVFAGKLESIQELAECGVRMVTLTWNGANEIGGGAGEPGGLTAFGKAALQEMKRCRIVPDISHASDELFWDVCEATDVPLVASHSNARTVCEHPRNLTDEQIREIIRRGGLIGINLYPKFVNGGEDNSFDELYRHVEHILSLGGEQVLALGTDFDGARMPSVIPNLTALEDFYEDLLRRNLKEEWVDAMFFGHAYKFFSVL